MVVRRQRLLQKTVFNVPIIKNLQFLRYLKFYFFAERYTLRLLYIQKWWKSNKKCKVRSQKCEKLFFEEIWPELAKNTKMAISLPLIDLDQNPLGVKSYLVIGIHPCYSQPIRRFDQFSLFLEWLTNRHLRKFFTGKSTTN